MLAPETVTKNHVHELNVALEKQIRPPEINLRRMGRDARALLSKGPKEAAEGYQLLGMLAVFSDDVSGIKENFSRAIRLQPDAPEPVENYFAALMNARCSSLATTELISYGLEKYVAYRTSALLSAVQLLGLSGHVTLATALLDRLGNDLEFERQDMIDAIDAFWIRTMSARLAEVTKGEDTLVRWIDCIERILHSKLGADSFAVHPKHELLHDGSASIVYHVPLTIEEAVSLNFNVADALAEITDCPLEHLPAISFVPHANFS